MTDSRQTQALNSIEEINLEDETILALLPGYVQRRRLESYKLHRLLTEGEYKEIRIIGHNLKGSGGLYGLPKVGEIGGQIEQLAMAKDHAKLAVQFEQLETYLASLDIE